MFLVCRMAVLAGLSVLLSACASVDQFGARIKDANTNSQDALNEETLLNVLRASAYQPLNFVAISQIAGGQMESLSTGLPSIILSPSKAVGTGPYQFTNSVSSGVSSSYQSNPLVSTDFENGLLSPLSQRDVALLLSANPRAPVLFSVIDSIVITQGDEITVLSNSPERESFAPPSPHTGARGDDFAACERQVLEAKTSHQRLFPGSICSFSKFAYVMNNLIANGFTVELVADRAGGASFGHTPRDKVAGTHASMLNKDTDKGNTASDKAARPMGEPCFDPSLASPSISGSILRRGEGLCSAVLPRGMESNATDGAPGRIRYEIDGKPASMAFNFRSPSGVYQYVGAMIRSGSAFPGYEGITASELLHGEKFFTVVDDDAQPCFVSTEFEGRTFCIPMASQHSAAIVSLLEQIRNLSIQQSDLNSAFTVRVE